MNNIVFSPSALPIASALQAHFSLTEAPILLIMAGIFVVGMIGLQIFVVRLELFLQAKKKKANKKTMKDIAKTKDMQEALDKEIEEEMLRNNANKNA